MEEINDIILLRLVGENKKVNRANVNGKGGKRKLRKTKRMLKNTNLENTKRDDLTIKKIEIILYSHNFNILFTNTLLKDAYSSIN
jgi:hypothetical protein